MYYYYYIPYQQNNQDAIVNGYVVTVHYTKSKQQNTNMSTTETINNIAQSKFCYV